MTLHAAPSSLNATIFEVQVTRCSGRPDCKSKQEIEEYLKTKQFVIHSSYVVLNFENHEKPEQINVRFPALVFLSQEEGSFYRQVITLDQNTFYRKDLWFNFFEEDSVSEYLTYSNQPVDINTYFENHD